MVPWHDVPAYRYLFLGFYVCPCLPLVMLSVYWVVFVVRGSLDRVFASLYLEKYFLAT